MLWCSISFGDTLVLVAVIPVFLLACPTAVFHEATSGASRELGGSCRTVVTPRSIRSVAFLMLFLLIRFRWCLGDVFLLTYLGIRLGDRFLPTHLGICVGDSFLLVTHSGKLIE